LYEEVRSLDGHFLVTPGHEREERVIAEESLYCVVVLGDVSGAHCGSPPQRLATANVSTEQS
jgi:hypothetical protein